MEIFYLILEVGNPLDMTWESRDVKEPPPEERRAQRDIMMVGGREQHPIVAIVAEFVWRQPTFPPPKWQAQGFTVGVAKSNSE